MSFRQPYNGPYRKLVLAFDVGTTFSGISYCILDPGSVPEIRGVTRFPAQEDVGGDSKIPTIIIYDKNGKLEAAGAEALDPRFEDEEDETTYVKAEWFKLHLRPKTKSAAHVTQKIPPLPQGKAAIDVFADFLKYLFKCAQIYIEQTHSNGVELWRSLQPVTEYVLTHPNGWEGPQQSMMRKAAATAGLIPDTAEGHVRVTFVTEGEASLHFCIRSGATSSATQTGKGIIIVDAGGGTIDISTYKQTTSDPQAFEETAQPQCHFKGSIFVTGNARTFLETTMKNSRFLDDVPHITRCFDKTTKLRFRNIDENQYIKFGTLKDRDPALNIRSGQLKLLGRDVASFFEPSVECIVKSVTDQQKASRVDITSVFLVGGFAASEWLYSQMKTRLEPLGLDICRPDSHVNKAVADGAISFHVDHFVNARVSKLAYGTRCASLFDPSDPDHATRQYLCARNLCGQLVIGGLFDVILPRDTKVTETQEFKQSYFRCGSSPLEINTIICPIFCYRGNVEMKTQGINYFVDKEPHMYTHLCSVQADLSRVPKHPKRSTYNGEKYYCVDIDVVLSLGLTELKAYVSWKENGVEKRSPAELVYDSVATELIRND